MTSHSLDPLGVALVDDDPAVLFALTSMLEHNRFDVRGYGEAGALLADLSRRVSIDCVIADVRMPGVSGLDLLENLSSLRPSLPLILITGYPDIDVAIAAMKAGARDFIVKPIDEARLVASINSVATAGRVIEAENRQIAELQDRVNDLRDRHRQVLELVVDGLTSKQIGDRLGISTRTVENYRAAVMERIGVGNIAQLVRIALRLKRPQ